MISAELKFSVLMAVYYRDDPLILRYSLDSIFLNTLQPTELILVQDGPVGAELSAVIEECYKRDNVTLIKTPRNNGLAQALNTGLEHIKTEFVVRADADDLSLPNRFAFQINQLHADFDLVGGSILEVDKLNQPIAIRQPPLTQDEIRRQLSKRNPFNHMTVAFRADFVRDCGGYPDVYLKEDYALWATMISKGARVANTSDILVHATAGREMYKRRGGLRYVKSEVALQRHLLKCGVTTLPKALLYGFLRSVVFLAPSRLRGWVYETFLRKGVQS